MPIVALAQVELDNPTTVEEQIGRAMCLACVNHFAQYLGQSGLGLSYTSCNAAVAINAHGSFPQVAPGGSVFSLVFGSSRLYSGLDPSFNQIHVPSIGRPFSSSQNEEHAEQTAIRMALGTLGLALWTYNGNCHIYIDLTPCNNCGPWLQNRPENWYVHYYTDLGTQKEATAFKKETRRDEFGRVMERKV